DEVGAGGRCSAPRSRPSCAGPKPKRADPRISDAELGYPRAKRTGRSVSFENPSRTDRRPSTRVPFMADDANRTSKPAVPRPFGRRSGAPPPPPVRNARTGKPAESGPSSKSSPSSPPPSSERPRAGVEEGERPIPPTQVPFTSDTRGTSLDLTRAAAEAARRVGLPEPVTVPRLRADALPKSPAALAALAGIDDDDARPTIAIDGARLPAAPESGLMERAPEPVRRAVETA